MKRFNLSRRTFMKSAAGGFAVSAMGAPFGAQQAFAAGLADQELRTVGLSVTVQERILADFKAKSGVKAVSGKGAIFPDTQTELLSGSTAYDCWETIGERLPAVTATNKIEPIATSALKNWNDIRAVADRVVIVDRGDHPEVRVLVVCPDLADDLRLRRPFGP